MIAVDARIPSGRINVIDASDARDVQLSVPKDPHCDLMGWYHFRVSGVKALYCRYRLLNAGESRGVRLQNREDFDDRWTNTGPLASYDLIEWFRLPARYDGMTFTFEHRSERDVCYYAAFAPYPPERDQRFIATAQQSSLVSVSTIGKSVEGRPIDMLTVGALSPAKKNVWLIARQHPSETQGGFFLEGMLERLLDETDDVSRALLAQCVIRIVPNMNPDGSAHGYSRSNSLGVNLNREWSSPSLARSPEVLCVQQAMEIVGVDFCMDCHADAELNCNFVWPSENVETWRPERRAVFEMFEQGWATASPDYGLGEPYPGGLPAKADLSMGWNWIGNRYPHALSVLLEQPFKDTRHTPVPATGWTPQRASVFGASFLNGLHAALPYLKHAG